MNYFEKIEKNPYEDLKWNIPEQKQGAVNIIGGNAGSFRTEMKVAEFLDREYPFKNVQLILPDSLKNKLPPLPNFVFVPSTDTGSFDESKELVNACESADFNLFLGDFSKNTVTGRTIKSVVQTSEKMALLTRDTIDLISDNSPEKVLMNENLILMASVAQLQKLLHAIYYPKMLLMSSSLVQVAETLHKFTLSYPVSIVTLHNEQILVAQNGVVKAVALEESGYPPLEFWNGEMAGKIVAMNLYNPNQFIEATIAAVF